MAEKPWRPPEWKNDWIPKFGEQYWAFEAGADALLEALFELARESPTKEFIIDGKEHHIYAKGE